MRTHIAVTLLAVAGCSSMGDVVSEHQRGGGTTIRYPIPPTIAYGLSRQVLRDEGADAIEEHPESGYMLTSSGMAAFHAGTYMGVWISTAGPDSAVTVVTKRKVATQFATTLTEEGFHRHLAQLVTAGIPPQR